jgi:hypothetical protein
VVIVVPGSLGVAPSHLRHAQTFVELGIAACVIDPFGRRGVTSTVSNQAQYSFAASAYDVLASVRVLSREPAIDAKRIGAQGHSRGGSAVLTAAMRRFSAPRSAIRSHCTRFTRRIRGAAISSRIRMSAQRWIRAVIGDRDDWCLPQCAQGHIQAIRLRGGRATLRIVPRRGPQLRSRHRDRDARRRGGVARFADHVHR